MCSPAAKRGKRITKAMDVISPCAIRIFVCVNSEELVPSSAAARGTAG